MTPNTLEPNTTNVTEVTIDSDLLTLAAGDVLGIDAGQHTFDPPPSGPRHSQTTPRR